MLTAEQLKELKEAIAASHSCGDWKQRIAHPEEPEAETWGSSDVIAENPETKKWGKIARVFDSGNMQLILVMRKHIEALLAQKPMGNVKPCPWCKSTPKVLPEDPSKEGGAWASVACQNPQCVARPRVDYWLDVDVDVDPKVAATEKWNSYS